MPTQFFGGNQYAIIISRKIIRKNLINPDKFSKHFLKSLLGRDWWARIVDQNKYGDIAHPDFESLLRPCLFIVFKQKPKETTTKKEALRVIKTSLYNRRLGVDVN